MSPDTSVVHQLRLLHPERRRQEALSAQDHPLWTMSPLAASQWTATRLSRPSGPSRQRPRTTPKRPSAGRRPNTLALISEVVVLHAPRVDPTNCAAFPRGASLAALRNPNSTLQPTVTVDRFSWKALGARCRRFSDPSGGPHHPKAASPSSTRLVSGSLGTASTQTRWLFRSVRPTPSTASTGLRCSAPCLLLAQRRLLCRFLTRRPFTSVRGGRDHPQLPSSVLSRTSYGVSCVVREFEFLGHSVSLVIPSCATSRVSPWRTSRGAPNFCTVAPFSKSSDGTTPLETLAVS